MTVIWEDWGPVHLASLGAGAKQSWRCGDNQVMLLDKNVPGQAILVAEEMYNMTAILNPFRSARVAR
jgi:hypothetical protein